MTVIGTLFWKALVQHENCFAKICSGNSNILCTAVKEWGKKVTIRAAEQQYQTDVEGTQKKTYPKKDLSKISTIYATAAQETAVYICSVWSHALVNVHMQKYRNVPHPQGVG